MDFGERLDQLQFLIERARVVVEGVVEDGRSYSSGYYEGLMQGSSLRSKREFEDARSNARAWSHDRNYVCGILCGIDRACALILPRD